MGGFIKNFMLLEQSRMFYSVPKCSRLFWNVKTCSNCLNTFFYMHNCDKVCVPKGVPKHMPKHVPNWAELIIDNSA